MKRIKAACLYQTVHFMLKEEMPKDMAIQVSRAEYASYLAHMDRSRVQYRVLEEIQQPDGSLVIKLKKQYNSYDCKPYMND